MIPEQRQEHADLERLAARIVERQRARAEHQRCLDRWEQTADDGTRHGWDAHLPEPDER